MAAGDDLLRRVYRFRVFSRGIPHGGGLGQACTTHGHAGVRTARDGNPELGIARAIPLYRCRGILSAFTQGWALCRSDVPVPTLRVLDPGQAALPGDLCLCGIHRLGKFLGKYALQRTAVGPYGRYDFSGSAGLALHQLVCQKPPEGAEEGGYCHVSSGIRGR